MDAGEENGASESEAQREREREREKRADYFCGTLLSCVDREIHMALASGGKRKENPFGLLGRDKALIFEKIKKMKNK